MAVHCGESTGRRRVLTGAPGVATGLSLLSLLFGALAVWLLGSPAASAASAAPATCRVGAYLSDLYDIDPAQHTFSARLHLWSVCDRKEDDPLPAASFTNANDPEKSEPALTSEGGRFRDLMRVQGVFRQDWDVRAFPFDRHRIEIVVTSFTDVEHFRFTPDNVHSAANEGIAPPGWRMSGFRLVTAEHRYPTNFGDPTLPRGMGSTHSRVIVQVDLARADPVIFWKLTGPLYLMLLIGTATFLLPSHSEELGMAERLDTLQSRLALLGGGLFVVMLNMQQVNVVVTSTVGLTLIDGLHLLTLCYVLVAVIGTVLSWRWTVRGGDPALAERHHHRGAFLGLVSYALLAAAMVGLAATVG
ncbi:hypothetical protein FGW37_26300 [Streptomyces rectiverticillatus]|uniref:hypothetical protein n=1 Tax=Streptomyces rectiverticillatus TaxID=173860 RepID=UPI0015C392CA|nr:hypothetical protein [Streptomyces rectiverticillatus]QLE74629.1 hypothetical protein FGW37_26300 [Streptomyces rectiverticillatus]